MLASKPAYPTAVGGSPNHVVTANPSSSSSSQYPSTTTASSTHRSQATSAGSSHGFFASPTESEFSESYEVPETVKYVKPCQVSFGIDSGDQLSDGTQAGCGTRNESASGFGASAALSTSSSSEVSVAIFARDREHE